MLNWSEDRYDGDSDGESGLKGTGALRCATRGFRDENAASLFRKEQNEPVFV
jgi:hypothetical protein